MNFLLAVLLRLMLPVITMLWASIGATCYPNVSLSVISALQHFASGILLCTIATEVIPGLHPHDPWGKTGVTMGFLLGAFLLLVMARYDFRHWKRCYTHTPHEEMDTAGDSGDIPGNSPGENLHQYTSINNVQKEKQTDKIPTGLIAAVLLDGAVDGLFIGISCIGSLKMGLLASIALAIEMALLGISYSLALIKTSLHSTCLVLLLLVTPLAIPLTGMLGVMLLSSFPTWQMTFLSFGCAGLLFLVTEELMIKAHSHEETDQWYVTIWFFLGFLIILMTNEWL